jgi:hypothetical protein
VRPRTQPPFQEVPGVQSGPELNFLITEYQVFSLAPELNFLFRKYQYY